MTDAFSHYENTAVRALEASDANESSDQLAHLLLQAAGQGRREAAQVAIAQGEIQRLQGISQAEKFRSTQFEANSQVQQAVIFRNDLAHEEALDRAEAQLAKAEHGKKKAVENLRPAYLVLKAIRDYSLDETISNKKLGRVVRDNLVAMDYVL